MIQDVTFIPLNVCSRLCEFSAISCAYSKGKLCEVLIFDVHIYMW